MKNKRYFNLSEIQTMPVESFSYFCSAKYLSIPLNLDVTNGQIAIIDDITNRHMEYRPIGVTRNKHILTGTLLNATHAVMFEDVNGDRVWFHIENYITPSGLTPEQMTELVQQKSRKRK